MIQVGLEELPLTLPPMFAEACGYRGSERHVALCWIPEERMLWVSDDGHAVLGEPQALLMLTAHQATAAALRPYHHANAHGAIRPWLVIDRSRRVLSFGDPAAVWRLLAVQSEHRTATARDRLVPDRRRQLRLEAGVSAWLDWMAKRTRRR
jgi:hypothetical protein